MRWNVRLQSRQVVRAIFGALRIRQASARRRPMLPWNALKADQGICFVLSIGRDAFPEDHAIFSLSIISRYNRHTVNELFTFGSGETHAAMEGN